MNLQLLLTCAVLQALTRPLRLQILLAAVPILLATTDYADLMEAKPSSCCQKVPVVCFWQDEQVDANMI